MARAKAKMKSPVSMRSEEPTLGVTQSTQSTIEVQREDKYLVVPLKVDKDTAKDWKSTLEDADLGKLVAHPFDGFQAAKDMDRVTVLADGSKLGNGDVVQVQLPNDKLLETTVLTVEGRAIHASWWAGVAVQVPLHGLYVRRVK